MCSAHFNTIYWKLQDENFLHLILEAFDWYQSCYKISFRFLFKPLWWIRQRGFRPGGLVLRMDCVKSCERMCNISFSAIAVNISGPPKYSICDIRQHVHPHYGLTAGDFHICKMLDNNYLSFPYHFVSQLLCAIDTVLLLSLHFFMWDKIHSTC